MKVTGIFKALGGLAIIGGGLLLGDKGKDIFLNGSHEAKNTKDDDEEDFENEIVIEESANDDSHEEE